MKKLGRHCLFLIFFSFDSPQQGAIIEYPLLDFIRDGDNDRPDPYNSMKTQMAKELLVYNPFAGNTHELFYEELNNLNGNGYPNQTEKNIAVSFSKNVENPNSGKWLEFRHKSFIGIDILVQDFFIFSGEEEKVAGSYLPESATRIAGVIPIVAMDGTFDHEAGVYYTRRFKHPTFIPYTSALDIDSDGNSGFDVIIDSEGHNFHDVFPDDVVNAILHEMDLSRDLSNITTPITIKSNSISFNEDITISGAGKLEIIGDNNTFNGKITINSGGELVVTDNTTTFNDDIVVNSNGYLQVTDASLKLGSGFDLFIYGNDCIDFSNAVFEQSDAQEKWNSIHLLGNNLSLEHSIIRGGNQNIKIEGNNAYVNDCIIEDANEYGIYIWNADNFRIYESEISSCENGLYVSYSNGAMQNNIINDNNGLGIKLYSSTIGINSLAPTNFADLFYGNIISGNGDIGIHVSYYSKIYFGQSSPSDNNGYLHRGYNIVKNNKKHEIFIEGNSGTSINANNTYNSIYDVAYSNTDGNKLIRKYNASAVYEDWSRIQARRNYWGRSSGPRSSDFSGYPNILVNYSPFLSSQPTISKMENVKLINQNKTKSVMSANDISLVRSKVENPIIMADLIDLKQKIDNKIHEINEKPQDPSTALRFLDLMKLVDTDPDNILNKQRKYNELIRDYIFNAKHAAKTGGTFNQFNLETALLLDLGNTIGNASDIEILEQIKRCESIVKNPDRRLELLSLKINTFIKLSNYNEAQNVLKDIKQILTKYPTQLKIASFKEIENFLVEKTGQELILNYNNTSGNNDILAKKFELSQNYPNPFNPTTKFDLTLPEPGDVTIHVYNTLGQKVATLANLKHHEAGKHTFTFNGTSLASGVYILHANTAGKNFTRKMILMK
jgi:hypothetical protein